MFPVAVGEFCVEIRLADTEKACNLLRAVYLGDCPEIGIQNLECHVLRLSARRCNREHHSAVDPFELDARTVEAGERLSRESREEFCLWGRRRRGVRGRGLHRARGRLTFSSDEQNALCESALFCKSAQAVGSIVVPGPVVTIAIGPDFHALSICPTVGEFAVVAIAIRPNNRALPIGGAMYPVSLEMRSARPIDGGFSVLGTPV